MKKAQAEKLARTIMDKVDPVTGVSAQTVADLGFMELIEAQRALHRIWLKGNVRRDAVDFIYHYSKQRDDYSRMGD